MCGCPVESLTSTVQAAAVGGPADDTDAADLRVTASPQAPIIYMPLITR
jgi:hypothetical protein